MFQGASPSYDSLLLRYVGQVLRFPGIIVIMVPAQNSDDGEKTVRVSFIIGEVDHNFSCSEMYLVLFSPSFAGEM